MFGWLKSVSDSVVQRRILRTDTSLDAFGLLRVSQPETIFDSKLTTGKSPVFWAETLIGAGASSTYIPEDACVRMGVSAAGEAVIRQTRMRFNYQPGKSQLFKATGRASTAPGVIYRVGLFQSEHVSPYVPREGIYFEVNSGVPSVNIVKGGVVRSVPQSEWNMDKLNGTGASRANVDWSKCQIFHADYQWLGVGGVRFGIVVNSCLIYCHEFDHAGIVDSVYMRTGSHPVRYEIRSTGGTGTADQICCSVSSEGGLIKTGAIGAYDTNGLTVNCPDTAYTAIVGMRLKATLPCIAVLFEEAYLLNSANSNFHWTVQWNPTLSATPTWEDYPYGDAVEVFNNVAGSIRASGGLPMAAGYSSRDARQSARQSVGNELRPGVDITGVPDTIVLAVRGIGGAATISGGLSFRQLL